MTVVITSGHFDPLHVGHIEYFELARKLGEIHLVIVNTNKSCAVSKGRILMDEDDRVKIVSSLKSVDLAVKQIDKDSTVCKTLEAIAQALKDEKLIFAKGGDRFAYEIPEKEVCDKYNIKIIDGLGKKIRSSSEIVRGK